MSHRKELYFDGHDRPDVVKYQQEQFLPKIKEYAHQLVHYVPGDVDIEFLDPNTMNCVEC